MGKKAEIRFDLIPQRKKVGKDIHTRVMQVMKAALEMSGIGDVGTLSVKIVDEEEQKKH